MKYTEEQRLDIAKHVYDRDLTVEEAAVKYDLSVSSIEKYLRLYRAKMGRVPRPPNRCLQNGPSRISPNVESR